MDLLAAFTERSRPYDFATKLIFRASERWKRESLHFPRFTWNPIYECSECRLDP